MSIFRKSVEKIQVSLKCHKNNGTLHEDLYICMILSRTVLLRLKNVSDESFKENQNTHFMFSNSPPLPPPKILLKTTHCYHPLYYPTDAHNVKNVELLKHIKIMKITMKTTHCYVSMAMRYVLGSFKCRCTYQENTLVSFHGNIFIFQEHYH